MELPKIFSGIFGGSQVDTKSGVAGKQKTEEKPEGKGLDTQDKHVTTGSDSDVRLITPKMIDSLPMMKQVSENKEKFIQDQGVIESTREVVETTLPDMDKVKPGTSFVAEQPTSKVLEKEVRLKSGVTITEDTEKHTVTISRNDGSGNPQTLAVLEDTYLQLPQKEESLGQKLSKAGLFSPITSANHDDIVIKNQNMREIISPNGVITIEDPARGASEPMPQAYLGGYIPYGAAGAFLGAPIGLSMLNKWHSDTYTITPEGQVSGKQFDKGYSFKPGLPIPTESLQESSANGEQMSDGSLRVKKGNDEIIYKPFLASKFVIEQPQNQ